MDLEYHKNFLAVDNYKQIKQLSDDLIELEQVTIEGKDLKIVRSDGYQMIIQGVVQKIWIRTDENDLQNQNEQRRLF